MKTFSEIIKGNKYPGRGIIIGASESGENAVTAYFITGRSENSRNRVFEFENGSLFTRPFDESKVKDPKLIIYRATAKIGDKLIVTNGDQTDTIVKYLSEGKDFKSALFSREYEPDEPNYTPRISGIVNFSDGGFDYALSILKKADDNAACERFFYYFEKINGTGKFIRTYDSDGNPLPSFKKEPETVFIPSDINAFVSDIWESLDEDNKISLFVNYVNLKSGKSQIVIKNKNER